MVKIGNLIPPVDPSAQKSQPVSGARGKEVTSFSDTLKQSIQEVNKLLGEAENPFIEE